MDLYRFEKAAMAADADIKLKWAYYDLAWYIKTGRCPTDLLKLIENTPTKTLLRKMNSSCTNENIKKLKKFFKWNEEPLL